MADQTILSYRKVASLNKPETTRSEPDMFVD